MKKFNITVPITMARQSYEVTAESEGEAIEQVHNSMSGIDTTATTEGAENCEYMDESDWDIEETKI